MPIATTVTTALPDHEAPFSHATELAEPGYYTVTLDDSKIRVELTATGHAAVHRWSFPDGSDAGVIFDLGHSNGKAVDSKVERVGKRELRGFARTNVHPLLSGLLDGDKTGDSIIYFVATFDHDIVDAGATVGGKLMEPDANPAQGEGVGAYLRFGPGVSVVTMRICISLLDVEQAKTNVDAEIGAADFDAIRAKARAAWNQALSRVQVVEPSPSAAKGADATALRVFYTALYHSLFQPADYTEVGGRFHSAADGSHHIHDGKGRHFYTDDWCMWDTFRTLHPLGTLVEPEIRSDITW